MQSYFNIDMTGPKISSFAILILSVTPAKTVGSTKNPLVPCLLPPVSNLAPSDLPC
jgi:hypothetical protein